MGQSLKAKYKESTYVEYKKQMPVIMESTFNEVEISVKMICCLQTLL